MHIPLLVHPAQKVLVAPGLHFTIKAVVDFNSSLLILISGTVILPLIRLRFSTSVPVAHA